MLLKRSSSFGSHGIIKNKSRDELRATNYTNSNMGFFNNDDGLQRSYRTIQQISEQEK